MSLKIVDQLLEGAVEVVTELEEQLRAIHENSGTPSPAEVKVVVIKVKAMLVAAYLLDLWATGILEKLALPPEALEFAKDSARERAEMLNAGQFEDHTSDEINTGVVGKA